MAATVYGYLWLLITIMATYGHLLLLCEKNDAHCNVSYLHKNPNNPSGIDLFLANCSRIFQDTHVTETGLSDFHKMDVTVFENVFY